MLFIMTRALDASFWMGCLLMLIVGARTRAAENGNEGSSGEVKLTYEQQAKALKLLEAVIETQKTLIEKQSEKIKQLEGRVAELEDRRSRSVKSKSDDVQGSGAKEILSLSGAVYLTRKRGDALLLRGVDVFLCDEEFEKAWSATMNRRYDSRTEFRSSSMLAFLVDLKKLSPLISEKSVRATAKTNVDGKYSFKNVPDGRYTLYCLYHTDTLAAAWVLPLSVEKSPKELELNNENAKVIIND